jgi:hypothetical protein
MQMSRRGLVALALGCLGWDAAFAQDPCAKYAGLIPGKPEATELGYRPRGTANRPDRRCEGLYSADRSGEEEVVMYSATDGPIEFTLGNPQPIRIAAAPGAMASGKIAVRAATHSQAFHYQMDTSLGPVAAAEWPPAEVLRPKGIAAGQLGVVGWITDGPHKIYVPLRVEQSAPAPQTSRRIVLKVFTPVPLYQLRWRLGDAARAGTEFSCASTANWQFRDDLSSFDPVEIVAPARPMSLQCLEIATQRSSNATARRSVLLFSGVK